MLIAWRLLPLMLLVLAPLQPTLAIWFPWYFHRYGFEPHSSRHGAAINVPPSAGSEKAATPAATGSETSTSKPIQGKGESHVCPPGYQLKDKSSATCPPGYRLRGKDSSVGQKTHLCDDNPLVMQLARLYVISPERIVLLLAQPMLVESCEEISDVLDRISSATSNCIVAEDNIYGKLADGLSYYKSEVCDGVNRKRQARLNEAHNCLKELRTDMIECEGPADWYEKRNATRVCRAFNDVLDCYYTRSAMLCGRDAARLLRSFAGDSMKRAMINNCEVNRRLPRVADAMPAFSVACPTTNYLNILLAFTFIILLAL